MNRAYLNHQVRKIRLRGSSLSLAVVILLAMSLVMASRAHEAADSGWLILLSVAMCLSVVLLLWRQVPVIWRDLTHYRKLQRPSNMQAMGNYVSWRFNATPQELSAQCYSILAAQGYRVHTNQDGKLLVLSAMKGRLSRVGLLFSHLAVLVILLGAVLDSDLGLRTLLATGKLQAETKYMPLNDMPVVSRIPGRSNLAFSGHENILAGQIIDEVRVLTAKGFLSRHLPYPISVQRVELDTNQLLLADNFISHVAILDSKRDKPLYAVLGNNRPFRYKGYIYYQQGVEDGDSELTIAMWALQHASVIPLKFRTRLGAERKLETRQGSIHVKFDSLRPRNVQSVLEEQNEEPVFKNLGPSLVYKVSESVDREREFINYLLPVKQNGRYFYISGVRDNSQSQYRFVHIPVDSRASLQQFLEFHAAMYDARKVERAIKRVLKDVGKSGTKHDSETARGTLIDLLNLFKQGGFAAIDENMATRVSTENFAQSLQLSHKLVRSLLYALYRDRQSGKTGSDLEEGGLLFFEDAIPAMSHMAEIAMPFYIQMQDMQFKPAVNIMVSRRPGELLFFTGWIILLSSLIFTFYGRHRRIWLVFEDKETETQVSMTGMGGRHWGQFRQEFNDLFTRLQKGMHRS